jgi:hypothetical protein
MAVRMSSLTLWQSFTPRKIPGTHFCYRLSQPQGNSAAGRIRYTEKSSDLMGNRTHDLPACSTVPQPTTLLLAPLGLGRTAIISEERTSGRKGGRERNYTRNSNEHDGKEDR